ncbi:hypothetical protein KFL_000230050 [Klebsormidium nitens]|uniref:F-box domain-containing protein n=1 Tax=Klebsormidium nitens TaxID=105231 RepID=A0A1Y1HKB9_KLENI|nr:hypothetical protein KFL_000230050 [Klebsormidium nitens]|eukprot:GAQ79024.1 hypothetical protein KFL_000230050 [Klebsormidium nitens]
MPIVARRLFWSAPKAPASISPGQDPVEVLGEDVFLRILGFVDSRALATCTLVCKSWGGLAREDGLWEQHLDELCRGKAAVPKVALTAESKMVAFGACLRDAKRAKIMVQDLCGTAFEFRFKWSAGDFWRNLDPSWRSEPPFIRVFHPDNVVSPGPNDTVFNDMTWKFTKTKDGKPGRYVRINQWPSLNVSRTENWGWTLQNCWVIYSSMSDSEMGRKLPADLREQIVSRR